MILDVGPGYNRGPSTNLKHCRRDDNCCAPAERAACAPGYRYSRGEPCDGDGRCGDHAVCCTRCLPGEACAEKSEDFGRAVRCGGRGTRFHWLPVTLVVALHARRRERERSIDVPGVQFLLHAVQARRGLPAVLGQIRREPLLRALLPGGLRNVPAGGILCVYHAVLLRPVYYP